MTQPDTHSNLSPVSDWTLERIALGELAADELVSAHERLAAEDGGLARLEALDASSAQILKEYPPEVIVPRIRARIARQDLVESPASFARGWWSGLGVGLAAAAAAVAFVVFVPPAEQPTDPVIENTTRLKGLSAHLIVHRAGDGGPERLSSGDRVSEGDVLQLGYVAGGEPFGTIVSIDGAGSVTLHHPEFATLAPVLDSRGRVDLPFSYELDDAPAYERFVFVTAGDPMDVDAVIEAARQVATGANPRTATLPLPETLHQESLLFSKGDRP